MKLKKQIAAALIAAVMFPVWPQTGWAQVVDPEPPPGPLVGVPVPLPDLTGIVRNREVAVALGKALFWDTQVGSDSVACASCHFHAGADSRAKNQLSPGLLRVVDPTRQENPDTTFGNEAGLTLSGGEAGPNYTLKPGDFPFHKLSDPEDRNSAVLFDMNDAVSSQGTFNGPFVSLVPRRVQERCGPADPSIFGVGGISTRKVEPRNTPTTINAVFNHRQFWDGRANNIFNGVDPFGLRNTKARVVVYDPAVRVRLEKLALKNASLASQAVGPPLSAFEMSCDGRTFPDLGRKLFSLRPLAQQSVHPEDSALGKFRALTGKGLNLTYRQLVQAAFDPKYWSAVGRYRLDNTGEPVLIPDGLKGFTQMELNFSMFWGISVMLYEASLVSDQTPFDKGEMTEQQKRGLQVFLGPGKCDGCHAGPLFTGATVDIRRDEAIERMAMAQGTAVYDGGFYNIGVRPTFEDLGLGGRDPFGNPLSFARQAVSGKIVDQFNFDPDRFELTGPITAGERVAVDGAFKVPTLRNVALTAPYMHNGGMSTLRQVVEFYDRGGDRRDRECGGNDGDTSGFGNAADLSRCSNLDPDITNLGLTEQQITDLVAFMEALTDPRVVNESAPFDHPELPVTNGHPGDEAAVTDRGDGRATDAFLVVPAVGKNGRAAQGIPPVGTFLNLDPQDE